MSHSKLSVTTIIKEVFTSLNVYFDLLVIFALHQGRNCIIEIYSIIVERNYSILFEQISL